MLGSFHQYVFWRKKKCWFVETHHLQFLLCFGFGALFITVWTQCKPKPLANSPPTPTYQNLSRGPDWELPNRESRSAMFWFVSEMKKQTKYTTGPSTFLRRGPEIQLNVTSWEEKSYQTHTNNFAPLNLNQGLCTLHILWNICSSTPTLNTL